MTANLGQVAALLEEPDPEARRQGAQQIGELEGPGAVALLARALGDDDWRVRKEAAMVAPTIQPRADVIERLFHLLSDHENIGLRNAAVEALIGIGREAVPGAVRALTDLDADGRKLAVDVLGGVPDLAGTKALARALDDEDINVRAAAAEALGAAGQAGAEAQALAIAALSAALSADEPLRRLSALNSLTRLEANLAWDVFEPLTKDPILRRYAITAAGRSHETAAIAALARAIGDPSIAVARDALVAVVDCLSEDVGREEFARVARHEIRATPGAEERIRAFARSIDDSRIRGAALVALGLLRTPSDVPMLVRGLSDEDVSDRAELGLRWFGHEAVPSLLEEGKRAEPSVRAVTLSLVPFLTDRADIPTLEALRDALRSGAPEVLTAGIQAIALAGGGTDLAILAPYATAPTRASPPPRARP